MGHLVYLYAFLLLCTSNMHPSRIYRFARADVTFFELFMRCSRSTTASFGGLVKRQFRVTCSLIDATIGKFIFHKKVKQKKYTALYVILVLGGFHIWRPQNFLIFYPLPPVSLSQISWYCSFRLLFEDPPPPSHPLQTSCMEAPLQ